MSYCMLSTCTFIQTMLKWRERERERERGGGGGKKQVAKLVLVHSVLAWFN